MMSMGAYDQIKKAFQDILAPEIHALRGDMQRIEAKVETVDAKVEALDVKMMAMKAELIAEIRCVNVRVDGVERELHTTTEIRERLAALEARQRS